MRRIPFLLFVMTGFLVVVSGSALASAGRSAAGPTNSSAPTIAGTAHTGETLTATSGSWDGATPISYGYQWQRCNSSGSGCGAIGQAKNQNYVLSNGDANRTIRVQVTATNSDGSNQALSAATALITAVGNVPANTKQPDPSGKAQEGQTVTVDEGQWTGQKPITFTLPVAGVYGLRWILHRYRRRDRQQLSRRLEPGRLDAEGKGHREQLRR